MELIINGRTYEIQPCANLRSADLWGADLRSANLFSADLRNANLRSADLFSASLFGANLRSADLWGANLCGADLRSANLFCANLHSADLCGANLFGAELRENLTLTRKTPVQILGLRFPIILFETNQDKYGKVGCKLLSLEEWEKFSWTTAEAEGAEDMFDSLREPLLSLLRNF